ncbi:LPS export ABC transporter periplasmic protein LptC [Adhaeribacter radiodurans]|uniref:LPS export ABC transporter periplasmic protein LptC n=1 Tax=Adhaeribacter radiodurans TaxID=2745197 RepID=A0A7L7LEB8_9BACT|nr:LPS export ABC transporter periplasmic protein LptC [Adhaeribacter radiodurans]QMU31161.1 LPS export ABC transporter periplasmic protein LptC [Adhaeribacter radiodurans]
MYRFEKLFCLLIAISSLIACNSGADNPVPKVKYTGPTMQSGNITTLYSDSARLKIKLNAKMQWQFENGDAEYPEGINLSFYNRNQQVSSTLRANYAKYDKQRDSYFARGNVVVNNIEKGETMKTEELHWDKVKRQIHTDKFVTVQTKTDIIQGNGLVSDDGFIHWKILNPTGNITVEQPQ